VIANHTAVPLCRRRPLGVGLHVQCIDVDEPESISSSSANQGRNTAELTIRSFAFATREINVTKRSSSSGGQLDYGRASSSIRARNVAGSAPAATRQVDDRTPGNLEWLLKHEHQAVTCSARSVMVKEFDIVNGHRTVENAIARVTGERVAPGLTSPNRSGP